MRKGDIIKRIIIFLLISIGAFCVVTSSYAELNALFVSDNIPSEMHPGERRRLNVVMENTGDEAWSGIGFRLRSISDPLDIWSWTTSYIIDDGITIYPGNQKEFILYLDAPNIPGTYESRWQMYDTTSHIYFGDIIIDSIWVDESVVPEWDSIVVDHTLPTELSPGEPRQVSVTMQNTGAGNWTGNRYALDTTLNRPVGYWGTDNYLMLGDEETVAPGEERTFTFVINAPLEEGIYDSIWQMVHIHAFSNYGERISELINVNSSVIPQLGSIERSNTIPIEMFPGETRRASITLENTGTVSWDENNVRFHAADSIFGLNVNNYLTAGEFIHRGEEKTFDVILTAPSTEGIFNCVWQMQGFFNEANVYRPFGTNVSVPVNITNTVVPESDSAFGDHTVPSVMEPNEILTVSITVINTGAGTWSGSAIDSTRLMSTNIPTDLWGSDI